MSSIPGPLLFLGSLGAFVLSAFVLRVLFELVYVGLLLARGVTPDEIVTRYREGRL